MSAVLLGDVGSLVEELQDRLAGFIELTVVAVRALSRSCKWNYLGAHC
jgi:hypothetical protein